jgi:hypothetical protein
MVPEGASKLTVTELYVELKNVKFDGASGDVVTEIAEDELDVPAELVAVKDIE